MSEVKSDSKNRTVKSSKPATKDFDEKEQKLLKKSSKNLISLITSKMKLIRSEIEEKVLSRERYLKLQQIYKEIFEF